MWFLFRLLTSHLHLSNDGKNSSSILNSTHSSQRSVSTALSQLVGCLSTAKMSTRGSTRGGATGRRTPSCPGSSPAAVQVSTAQKCESSDLSTSSFYGMRTRGRKRKGGCDDIRDNKKTTRLDEARTIVRNSHHDLLPTIADDIVQRSRSANNVSSQVRNRISVSRIRAGSNRRGRGRGRSTGSSQSGRTVQNPTAASTSVAVTSEADEIQNVAQTSFQVNDTIVQAGDVVHEESFTANVNMSQPVSASIFSYPEFKILPGSSKRGKDLLIEKAGYSYSVGKRLIIMSFIVFVFKTNSKINYCLRSSRHLQS